MQKRAKNKGPITIAAVFGEDLAAAKACTAAASGASLAPVKRKRRSRMMEYFAGLDVSIEETAICVVGDDGKVVLETEVPTEPELIAEALERFAGRLRRVGHEAGSVSPWLHAGLLALGLPAVCLETRHVRAALSAQRNKTDAADALGIAHIMRTGWFRQAHIKTEECYRVRLLLVQRRNLKRKFLDIENAIRHSLKVFGIRLGKVGRGSMEKAVREAVAGDAMTAGLMDCMLRARAALWEEYLILHKLRSKFFWKQSPQSRNLPLFDRGWMTECGTLWSVRFGVAKPAKQDCCLPVLPTQAGYNPLGLMRSVGPTGRRRTILSDDRKHSDLT